MREHCCECVVTSSRGCEGNERPRTCPATHEAMPAFFGLVETVTPTARPFCTAAQMLTDMFAGTPQGSRYLPLLSTEP